MRITYYQFPDDTPEEVLLEHGCGVVVQTRPLDAVHHHLGLLAMEGPFPVDAHDHGASEQLVKVLLVQAKLLGLPETVLLDNGTLH